MGILDQIDKLAEEDSTTNKKSLDFATLVKLLKDLAGKLEKQEKELIAKLNELIKLAPSKQEDINTDTEDIEKLLKKLDDEELTIHEVLDALTTKKTADKSKNTTTKPEDKTEKVTQTTSTTTEKNKT